MSTTADLLRHVEAINHELLLAAAAIDDAVDVEREDVRYLRRTVTTMREDSQRLLDWVVAARLKEAAK